MFSKLISAALLTVLAGRGMLYPASLALLTPQSPGIQRHCREGDRPSSRRPHVHLELRHLGCALHCMRLPRPVCLSSSCSATPAVRPPGRLSRPAGSMTRRATARPPSRGSSRPASSACSPPSSTPTSPRLTPSPARTLCSPDGQRTVWRRSCRCRPRSR